MDFEDTALRGKFAQGAEAARAVIEEVRDWEAAKKDFGVMDMQELGMGLKRAQIEAGEAERDFWQSAEICKEAKKRRDLAEKRLNMQTDSLQRTYQDSQAA